MSDAELAYLSARELARRLRGKDLSAEELMRATLERIERVNPALNAIVTLDADRAREGAKSADLLQAAGGPLGPLHFIGTSSSGPPSTV